MQLSRKKKEPLQCFLLLNCLLSATNLQAGERTIDG